MATEPGIVAATIEAGYPWSTVVPILTAAGAPADLTGYHAAASFGTAGAPAPTVVVSDAVGGLVITAAAGLLTITLTAAQTAALAAPARWWVDLTDPSGATTPAIVGPLALSTPSPVVSLDDCTRYLRLDSTAENDLVADLLARAWALLPSLVNRPIAATPMTVVIDDPRASAWDVPGLAVEGRPLRALRFPATPLDPTTVTITDREGLAWASTAFRVRADIGLLTAVVPDQAFDRFPYTIAATAGLATRDDYLSAVAPVLAMAVIDLVSDWYQRRNPEATVEAAGGGISTAYNPRASRGSKALPAGGVPIRVREVLAPIARWSLV